MFEIILKNTEGIKDCKLIQGIKSYTIEAIDDHGETIKICNDVIVSRTSQQSSKHSGDTESRSPFHKTVEGMLSEDYKERFKAEYQQTKIRWERLKAFNAKILASKINVETEEPKHDCPDGLLLDKEKTMRKYLDTLELRAVIEGVDLNK